MPKKFIKPENKMGLRRVINATRYSYQGLIITFKTEAAFRQEIYLGLFLLPLSFIIANTLIEWLLLILTFLLILSVELLNSAIEATVDRFSEEHHQLSAKAKDAGSAAVFIAMLAAGITWCAIALL